MDSMIGFELLSGTNVYVNPDEVICVVEHPSKRSVATIFLRGDRSWEVRGTASEVSFKLVNGMSMETAEAL